MKKIQYSFLIIFSLSQTIYGQTDEETIIKDILNRQVECWNQGDLACFMKGYWESDQLMFIGGSGITYGFENTLKGFRSRYPDRKTMGKLKFEIKEMKKVAESVYLVVGKYFLTREIGNVNGHFSLLWQKINNEWVIVADHSSQKQ